MWKNRDCERHITSKNNKTSRLLKFEENFSLVLVFEGLFATQHTPLGPRSITYTERRVLGRSFSKESAIYHHGILRQQRRATEDQISEYMKTYKDIKLCENTLRTIREAQEK